MNDKLMRSAVPVLLCLLLLLFSDSTAHAQGEVNSCSSPLNISNSGKYTSADPFLLADPTGTVHLFWAERTTGGPDSPTNVPDTLMYAAWNGATWTTPVDIFLSPKEMWNKTIASIKGVLDEQGVIHLVWRGPDNTFFYSAARADEAGSAQAWQPPLLLADDQIATQYSVDIAYTPPHTLHILYGRTPDVENGGNGLLTYIRSEDGGLTWSEPRDLHAASYFDRGFSNIRLLPGDAGTIYGTWTEWDQTGNGQAVYFVRSLDGGMSWEPPVQLDERVGDEYERDWTNPAVLGDNQLVAIWEGGFRAYPQAQYSDDGGVTWSEPIDTFPWLISDDGFAQYARDSNGQLHVFLARRIREGYEHVCAQFVGCTDEGNTIWHSVWEGGRSWRAPEPVDEFRKANFISVAMRGGNQVVFAWFTYADLDVMVKHCTIDGAPALPLEQQWPTPTSVQLSTMTPEPMPRTVDVTSTPSVSVDVVEVQPEPPHSSSLGRNLLLGVTPSLLLVLMAVAIVQVGRRR